VSAPVVVLLLAVAPALWQRAVPPPAAPATPLVTPPPSVRIVTPRGEARVPISFERGSAALAAALLVQPLGLTMALDGSGATVTVASPGSLASTGSATSAGDPASAAFVFQLGTPFVRAGGVVYGLDGEAYLIRDTLFLGPRRGTLGGAARGRPRRRGSATPDRGAAARHGGATSAQRAPVPPHDRD